MNLAFALVGDTGAACCAVLRSLAHGLPYQRVTAANDAVPFRNRDLIIGANGI